MCSEHLKKGNEESIKTTLFEHVNRSSIGDNCTESIQNYNSNILNNFIISIQFKIIKFSIKLLNFIVNLGGNMLLFDLKTIKAENLSLKMINFIIFL